MDFEKVVACIKAIGMKPHITNFNDKLIIQKAIFLLQRKGIDCGVKYNLYIRGPYAPELTKCMYDKTKKLESLETDKELSKSEESKIIAFREIFTGLSPGVLEVAATYSYFAYERNETPLESLRKVKELKGFYPEAQIALGVSKAKQFLYEPTIQEMEKMKKEFSAWESA